MGRARAALQSEAWEELCRASVPHLHLTTCALGRLGPWEPARRWWRANEPDLDLVARSADRSRLLVGEVKWSGARATGRDLALAATALIGRGTGSLSVPPGAKVVHALFIPEVPAGLESATGVQVVDAACVLDALR